MKRKIKLHDMKRIYVICVILFLILLLPIISMAEKQEKCEFGTFYYRELDDGTVELTGFNAKNQSMDIVLPDRVGTKVVSSMDGTDGWPRWTWRDPRSILIPNDIVTIKENPFYDIYLYDWIGEFKVSQDHPTLEVINGCLLDKTQKKLIAESGRYSSSIPDGVEILGKNCRVELSSVNIPDSVSIIEHGAFFVSEQSDTPSIVIPKSITQLRGNPFVNNNSAFRVKISLEQDHPTLEISNGALYDKTEHRLIYVLEDANRIDVLPGTRIIEPAAVHGMTKLVNINLPEGLETIGKECFSLCSNLKTVNIPDSVKLIGPQSFEQCQNLEKVNIPDGVTEIGDRTFYQCKKLKSITIPDSVTSIEHMAFENCKGLKSITIPDSVTNIGTRVFVGCEGLKSITIPDSVTSIGTHAFGGCTGLKSVIIPDSVTNIEYGAFYGCTQLKEVVIGNGITDIGGNYNLKPDETSVFERCNVESLTITGSIRRWKFSDEFRAKIKTVTVGEGTTEVEKNVFCMYKKLEKVSLPDSVTVIEEKAFNGCRKLKTVNLPSGLKKIAGKGAFHNCEALESITIPSSLSSIPEETFADCKKLKTVVIENGITCINKKAFINCASISSIIIPGSVQYIGKNAFDGCKTLRNVVIEDGVIEIREDAFKDCTNLKTITIPKSVKSITAAFNPKKTKMIVDHNSYAEQYCKANSISYSYADDT